MKEGRDRSPILEGNAIKASRIEGASYLRVEILDNQSILSARVKRVFPLSSAEEYFSIQDQDDDEVAILKSLEGTDPMTRKLLEEEFDRRYFSPVISKINAISNNPEMRSFDVETNRGPIVFFVRNWRESSYEIEANRWHITTVDGQRFEIADLDGLDKHSQKLIEQLL